MYLLKSIDHYNEAFIRVPVSFTPPSVRQKRATPFQPPKSLSTKPKTYHFHTKNLSVQHQKPLSSTQKKAQYKLYISELRGVC